MKKKEGYVVVVTYSFDPDTSAYYFNDYDKACEYMEKMWEECCNYERKLAENDYYLDEDKTYCDESYAELVWSDGYKRIWQVVCIDFSKN